MKRIPLILMIISLLISACAAGTPAPAGESLTVSGGEIEKAYTVDALEALESSQAVFRDVTYTGVPLTALLEDAGFSPQSVKAVKAVAVDGFTVNYEPELFTKEDTLVAYAQADGPLSEEDGSFRMVLPDQEGKLNPRQLVEIQVIP